MCTRTLVAEVVKLPERSLETNHITRKTRALATSTSPELSQVPLPTRYSVLFQTKDLTEGNRGNGELKSVFPPFSL
jgi:hypothetical protein